MSNPADGELDEILAYLVGATIDNGYRGTLKEKMERDNSLRDEAKQRINELYLSKQEVQAIISKMCLAGMPEITPRQQDYITKELAKLNIGEKDE